MKGGRSNKRLALVKEGILISLAQILGSTWPLAGSLGVAAQQCKSLGNESSGGDILLTEILERKMFRPWLLFTSGTEQLRQQRKQPALKTPGQITVFDLLEPLILFGPGG